MNERKRTITEKRKTLIEKVNYFHFIFNLYETYLYRIKQGKKHSSIKNKSDN